MNNYYLTIIDFIDGLFLPLFYFLGLFVPPDASGAFEGVAIVMSWVGYIHTFSFLPGYFVLTLDILALSFLASLVMRFVRWVIDVIPFV